MASFQILQKDPFLALLENANSNQQMFLDPLNFSSFDCGFCIETTTDQIIQYFIDAILFDVVNHAPNNKKEEKEEKGEKGENNDDLEEYEVYNVGVDAHLVPHQQVQTFLKNNVSVVSEVPFGAEKNEIENVEDQSRSFSSSSASSKNKKKRKKTFAASSSSSSTLPNETDKTGETKTEKEIKEKEIFENEHDENKNKKMRKNDNENGCAGYMENIIKMFVNNPNVDCTVLESMSDPEENEDFYMMSAEQQQDEENAEKGGGGGKHELRKGNKKIDRTIRDQVNLFYEPLSKMCIGCNAADLKTSNSHVAHVIPYAYTGVVNHMNSMPACPSCNTRCGKQNFIEFVLCNNPMAVRKVVIFLMISAQIADIMEKEPGPAINSTNKLSKMSFPVLKRQDSNNNDPGCINEDDQNDQKEKEEEYVVYDDFKLQCFLNSKKDVKFERFILKKEFTSSKRVWSHFLKMFVDKSLGGRCPAYGVKDAVCFQKVKDFINLFVQKEIMNTYLSERAETAHKEIVMARQLLRQKEKEFEEVQRQDALSIAELNTFLI